MNTTASRRSPIIGKSREPGEVGIKKVLYGEDLA